MQITINKNDDFRSQPLLRLIGEYTGLGKGLFEVLLDFDDPDIFNVVIEESETQKAAGSLRCGGAGVSLREAIRRAMGELLERYSLLNYCEAVHDCVLFSTYDKLTEKAENAISPEMIPLFSETQYAHPDFPFRRARNDTLLGWVKGLSLVSEREVYVPAQLIYLGYRRAAGEPLISPTTSSGAAAARSYSSATLKGLCEAIERDAVMRTWYCKESPPSLNFEHTQELDGILKRIGNKGFQYKLFLLSSALPNMYVTMSCVLNEQFLLPNALVAGSASLDPIETCYKSLLEAAQSIPFAKAQNLIHHNERIDPERLFDFELNGVFYARPQNFEHLSFLLHSCRSVELNELKTYSCGDAERDLTAVAQQLRNANTEALVFDSTLPGLEDTGYKVVKVFCPQLVSLCLPSSPFLGNPRLSGSKNTMPHPYP